jgi:hypothetical protein
MGLKTDSASVLAIEARILAIPEESQRICLTKVPSRKTNGNAFCPPPLSRSKKTHSETRKKGSAKNGSDADLSYSTEPSFVCSTRKFWKTVSVMEYAKNTLGKPKERDTKN